MRVVFAGRDCQYLQTLTAKWIKTELRGKTVFAQIDENGQYLKEEKSRTPIVYSLKPGAKIYRANPTNLAEPSTDAVDNAVALDIEASENPQRSNKNTDIPKTGNHDIVIWTDGACTGNPGPMGIGAVVIEKDGRREIGDFIGEGTNNIAELTAIQKALESIATNKRQLSLIVHTDSSYCIGVLSKNWKAKANVELIATIRALLATFANVTFNKVKGHAGIPDNERCDQLATEAIANR